MQDQVESLLQLGVKAAFLNSSLAEKLLTLPSSNIKESAEFALCCSGALIDAALHVVAGADQG